MRGILSVVACSFTCLLFTGCAKNPGSLADAYHGGILAGSSSALNKPSFSYAPSASSRSRSSSAPAPLASVAPPKRRGLGELWRKQKEESNTESYDELKDNPFLGAERNPLSTFSVDVDTAAYSNLRRMAREGDKVPRGAVRIEEMLNYFPYDYPLPQGDAPFSVSTEIATVPWKKQHRLMRVGLRSRAISKESRPPANFVFLVDVSGSMSSATKLPLLRRSMKLLVEELSPRDRVAVVVYAGASGLVLPSTPASHRNRILTAIEELESGGSTNGGEGIQLAYEIARKNFRAGGINRVILATDGDFNVGTTDESELVALIQEKAKSGVFLSVLGYGMGNYKDSTLEKLADKGNGNYAYIDSIHEARKVLVRESGASLVTVAKDVKIQVEFNPAEVAAYRLIGYENRLLAAEDFNDDTKDAGEIGAGHRVTALYEIVPAGVSLDLPDVDQLKYQRPSNATGAAASGELATVKLRYKSPRGSTSRLLKRTVRDGGKSFEQASTDFRFSAAVAATGMLLRKSEYSGDASRRSILTWARGAKGRDRFGYREEFVRLAGKLL